MHGNTRTPGIPSSRQPGLTARKRSTLQHLLSTGLKRPGDVELQHVEDDTETRIQRNRLSKCICPQDSQSGAYLQAYLDFLQERMLDPGQDRLNSLLNFLGYSDAVLQSNALRVVADVAELVNGNNNPLRSIHDILLALLQRHGIAESALKNTDVTNVYKAVFTVLCWLSALVQSDTANQEGVYLRLERHVVHQPKRPFIASLRSFGTLLPGLEGSSGIPDGAKSVGSGSSQIYVSSINYRALRMFGKIKLLWTDSLSEHLIFDQSGRTLSLFRYPGLCVATLMAGSSDAQVLSRLLDNYYSESEPNGSLLRRYLQEVLLSYWLLFGQHRKSRMLFASRESSLAAGASPNPSLDAVLSIICGGSGRKSVGSLPQELWLDTCVDDKGRLLVQDVYDVPLDFQLLGDRLLNLQAFNTRQRPSRIRDLWRDRRDPLQWYTFWAVIFVGGTSIILSFVQCGLSAAQLYSQIHVSS